METTKQWIRLQNGGVDIAVEPQHITKERKTVLGEKIVKIMSVLSKEYALSWFRTTWTKFSMANFRVLMKYLIECASPNVHRNWTFSTEALLVLLLSRSQAFLSVEIAFLFIWFQIYIAGLGISHAQSEYALFVTAYSTTGTRDETHIYWHK